MATARADFRNGVENARAVLDLSAQEAVDLLAFLRENNVGFTYETDADVMSSVYRPLLRVQERIRSRMMEESRRLLHAAASLGRLARSLDR